MPISRVPVTGRLVLPDDSVPGGGHALFTLSGWDTEGENVVVPPVVRAALSGTGDLPADFELWRNTSGSGATVYAVSVVHSGGLVALGNIQLGAASTYDIGERLREGATPGAWVPQSKVPPGTAAAPGLAFVNDPDSGLYLDADGRVSLAVQGLAGGALTTTMLTRAALVAARNAFATGAIVRVGNLLFIKDGGTRLSGLSGWSALGPEVPGHHGQTDVLGVSYESVASGGMAAVPTLRTRQKPLVIFVSGQSNSEDRSVYDWSPEARIRHWTYYGSGYSNAAATTTVGVWSNVALAASNGVTKYMSYGRGIAEAASRDHPDRPIYLLTVGKGGLGIAQWIDGASDPQMMTAIRNNVPVALTRIQEETGWTIETPDCMFWWQGESDYLSATYAAQFETLIAQLRAEAWFDYQTPIVMAGCSRYGNGGSGWQAANIRIQEAIAAEPECRTFFDPGLYPEEFWNPPTLVHMTGQGYRLAGVGAWQALGHARGVPHFWETLYDRQSGQFLWGDGMPAIWEFTFRRGQIGTTSVASHNTSTDGSASAQFIAASGVAQLAMTAFSGGSASVVSNAAGAFDLHANNATGSLRLLVNGTAMLTISAAGVLGGSVVQSSLLDTTPGRLSLVGAFGLGTFGSGTDFNADAADLPTRIGRMISGTLPGAGFWHGMHISKVQNAQGAQLVIREGEPSEERQAAIRHRNSAGVWSAWSQLVVGDKTTSATDGTTGRVPVMRQAGGIFGLGSIARPLLANLDDTTLLEGGWRYDAATTGTYPSGSPATIGYVDIKRLDATIFLQTLTEYSSACREWRRRWTNGPGFSAWEGPF
jgi:hypothetical protein